MTPEWDEQRGATGLEPTEGLLRAITTSVADALYVVDQDERVLYTNPAGLRMLGYDDLSQLVGRVSHETIHYMHADGTPFPAADCPLLEPKRGGGMVRVEDDHFIRRDGSFVPVAYSSAPLVLRSGVGAVVAFRDLTPRLRLEAAARMGEIQRVRAEELEASRARIAHAADAAMRQIERDLHDGAQQRLGAIAVRLEVIRKTLETNPADAAKMLEQTQAELLEALRELRELARGIRPAILRERGLVAAIRALAMRAPIEVATELDDIGSLPASVESAAYFVSAEALSNVARHSGASSATIVLRREHDAISVTVRDDGNGRLDERLGSGISGLRDRVEALGGSFSATSMPGRGTVIEARLPLEPEPGRE
jgi:PAS domain S-box-containing protein